MRRAEGQLILAAVFTVTLPPGVSSATGHYKQTNLVSNQSGMAKRKAQMVNTELSNPGVETVKPSTKTLK